VHAPFVQVEPPPQMFPHLPQFPLSVASVTQAPLQFTCGALQELAQTPPLQTAVPPAGGGGQAFPQAPQLARLASVLMHCPPHIAWPVGQEHAPMTHWAPPVHTLAQPPQFVRSLWRFTHALLQFVSAAPESVAHVNTQAPFKQSGVPAGHTRPQRPQLAAFEFKFTQTGPASPGQAASGEQLLPSGSMLSTIASASASASASRRASGPASGAGPSRLVLSVTDESAAMESMVASTNDPSGVTPLTFASGRADPSPGSAISRSDRPHPVMAAPNANEA
jgi:hypothetical protein